MKLTKTTRFFIVYTLYFVLALGAYIFFYVHIDGKSNTATNTLSEISQLQQQNMQMQNLKQTIKDTEEARTEVANFFVDSDMIIEFLETIEGMAGKADVEIDVKSINEIETEAEGIKELSLNIDFEGDWISVHHFMVLLENIPIKMTIDRLNFRETVSREKDENGEIIETVAWRGSAGFKTLQLKK